MESRLRPINPKEPLDPMLLPMWPIVIGNTDKRGKGFLYNKSSFHVLGTYQIVGFIRKRNRAGLILFFTRLEVSYNGWLIPAIRRHERNSSLIQDFEYRAERL
jgi:hypothetical protein